MKALSLRPNPSRAWRSLIALCCLGVLAACGQTEKKATAPTTTTTAPSAATTPAAQSTATGTTTTSPTTGVVTGAAPAGGAAAFQSMTPAEIALLPVLTPASAARYSCVTAIKGETHSSPILLPDGSERICSRFPAMGPCKYERDQCRAKGGKVIRFDGAEITPAVEAEYDKQVMRFRFNS